MNSLYTTYREEIDKILAKYPPEEKRSAVMPLLYIAQREQGYVTKENLREVGEIIDVSPTDVGSIVGFYTLYYDHPGGKYRIQVCNDLPCALRGADEFLEKLCDNLGIKVGETTADGLVTVEAVMCLAACDRAPMFQVQDDQGIRYYENQSVESALQLVEHWRTDAAAPAPSPAGAVVESSGPQPPSLKQEAEVGEEDEVQTPDPTPESNEEADI